MSRRQKTDRLSRDYEDEREDRRRVPVDKRQERRFARALRVRSIEDLVEDREDLDQRPSGDTS